MEFPILLYHRIEKPGNLEIRLSGEACPIDRFESQLRVLKENFSVIPLAVAADAVKNRKPLPENAAVLTFDDGTKDQYKYALPLLREYGLHATFFVMSAPLKGIVPGTFKLQLLTGGSASMDYIMSSLPGLLRQYARDQLPAWENGVTVPATSYIGEPSEEVRQFKYFMNFVLNAEQKDEVTNALFRRAFDDPEAGFAKRMFLSPSEIIRIESEGHTIGGHTHMHYNLRALRTQDQLRSEIVKSKQILQNALHTPIRLFAFAAGDYTAGVEGAQALVEETYDGAVILGDQKTLCSTDESPHLMRRLHEKYFEEKLL